MTAPIPQQPTPNAKRPCSRCGVELRPGNIHCPSRTCTWCVTCAGTRLSGVEK